MSYCIYGIANAIAEGINSMIMTTKRRVSGYRNRQNFYATVFPYCGGLDPHTR